ncbi:MAG: hypothetical protein JSV78_06145, partial [Phycisphaerales bacterium]
THPYPARSVSFQPALPSSIRHSPFAIRHSAFGVRHSTFPIPHSTFPPGMHYASPFAQAATAVVLDPIEELFE